MKKLIEYIIKQLVEQPEQVTVEIFHDPQKTKIEVKVVSDDIKRVIGKDGGVVKALRILAGSINESNKDIEIDIVPVS